jgi:hypothetical protein
MTWLTQGHAGHDAMPAHKQVPKSESYFDCPWTAFCRRRLTSGSWCSPWTACSWPCRSSHMHSSRSMSSRQPSRHTSHECRLDEQAAVCHSQTRGQTETKRSRRHYRRQTSSSSSSSSMTPRCGRRQLDWRQIMQRYGAVLQRRTASSEPCRWLIQPSSFSSDATCVQDQACSMPG